ncbi:hypothetical protein [Pseudomonas sp.]|uniref:hypothetical protein n=1 Tax=Pseudomonas sp. TaxID=306 RepID=UPI0032651D20
MKPLLVAGIALTLSGCGNISNIRAYSTPYVEPTSGDTARLRIITNGMARGVPGRDCIDWRVPGSGVMAVLEKGFADQNNGRSLDMPPSERQVGGKSVRTELKIPANQPFAMNFQSEGSVSSGYSYSCQQTFRFTPKAGQDYELMLLEGGNCLLSLERLNTEVGRMPERLEKAGLCNAMDAL